ncbi:MAG: amidohydrolase family protein [Pseudomonadales bacterium]|nr:amidohydrolase family protein [Pseudomonadales bacterium]
MTVAVSHREGRIIHDADSHIAEPIGWLNDYASEYVKANLQPGVRPSDLEELQPFIHAAEKRLAGDDPDKTSALKADVFAKDSKVNPWSSFGSVDSNERSEMLNITGIEQQLLFSSPLAMTRFAFTKDEKLLEGGCEALNRGMADFCSNDPRLMPVGFVSMSDPALAYEIAKKAIDLGIKALWVPSDAIGGRAPSHVEFDPVWALAEEAKVPIVLHIGSGRLMGPAYRNTGIENRSTAGVVTAETTSAKDFPVIHHSTERWLCCLIYDGVLERFPNLKIGLIELGANWLPMCMMNLDIGVSELGKFDENLKTLSMKPSDYVRRQVRATPFHMEDAGWILRHGNVGPDVLMFNTDYPHMEGGTDPFGDFERSLNAVDATERELDNFYSKNFENLMGL